MTIFDFSSNDSLTFLKKCSSAISIIYPFSVSCIGEWLTWKPCKKYVKIRNTFCFHVSNIFQQTVYAVIC